jgi:hypothetical protein
MCGKLFLFYSLVLQAPPTIMVKGGIPPRKATMLFYTAMRVHTPLTVPAGLKYVPVSRRQHNVSTNRK